jgi:hypothetical protein
MLKVGIRNFGYAAGVLIYTGILRRRIMSCPVRPCDVPQSWKKFLLKRRWFRAQAVVPEIDSVERGDKTSLDFLLGPPLVTAEYDEFVEMMTDSAVDDNLQTLRARLMSRRSVPFVKEGVCPGTAAQTGSTASPRKGAVSGYKPYSIKYRCTANVARRVLGNKVVKVDVPKVRRLWHREVLDFFREEFPELLVDGDVKASKVVAQKGLQRSRDWKVMSRLDFHHVRPVRERVILGWNVPTSGGKEVHSLGTGISEILLKLDFPEPKERNYPARSHYLKSDDEKPCTRIAPCWRSNRPRQKAQRNSKRVGTSRTLANDSRVCVEPSSAEREEATVYVNSDRLPPQREDNRVAFIPPLEAPAPEWLADGVEERPPDREEAARIFRRMQESLDVELTVEEEEEAVRAEMERAAAERIRRSAGLQGRIERLRRQMERAAVEGDN